MTLNTHYNKPTLVLNNNQKVHGKTAWRSPSNIALIKYWGKKPGQIPCNASLSFTLSEAHTNTYVEYSNRQNQAAWIDFKFEGSPEPTFAAKIEKFFRTIADIFPFLEQLSFKIESDNSFPHSSGIASSASSMSALSLALCSIESALFGTLDSPQEFYKKASYISRIGSGSASRSVYPYLGAWGVTDRIAGSSDLYAVPYVDVHESFLSFHDDVVIVSADKKSVSSTAGHALMNSNPFARTRYEQAKANLSKLVHVMKTGDLTEFGKIVEDEALTLHALMMCSDPSFILMKPKTLECIDRIRRYRAETKAPIYFTLDAGPNVHVLYPEEYANAASAFIATQLEPLAEGGLVIRDQVGKGPMKIESA